MFKLALLASDAVEPVGSGGDLAASSFTGWVCYSSPDRQWLRRRRREAGVAELLAADWPGLAVRRMRQADGIDLLVGWTGEPASTSRFVTDVKAHTQGLAPVVSYTQFLSDSDTCLAGLVRALEAADLAEVTRCVGEHRKLLAGLARLSGVVIETPELDPRGRPGAVHPHHLPDAPARRPLPGAARGPPAPVPGPGAPTR